PSAHVAWNGRLAGLHLADAALDFVEPIENGPNAVSHHAQDFVVALFEIVRVSVFTKTLTQTLRIVAAASGARRAPRPSIAAVARRPETGGALVGPFAPLFVAIGGRIL